MRRCVRCSQWGESFLITDMKHGEMLTVSKLTNCAGKNHSWDKQFFSCSKNSPHFMQPERSFPCWQEPATCFYSRPGLTSPPSPPPSLISWRSIIDYRLTSACVFKVVSFHDVEQTKHCMHLSSSSLEMYSNNILKHQYLQAWNPQ